MTSRDAFIAVNRFGLGARSGDLAVVASDPRGWVSEQLDGTPSLPPQLASFPASATTIANFQAVRKASKKSKDRSDLKEMRKSLRNAYVAEAAARTQVQIETETPAVERLVMFWSNHFTISIRKSSLVGVVGAFEREAIRPHVTGKFADMLRAVVRHPGMLVYLDNAQSIGPNSKVGRKRKRGLNENLAREILELHTLGVDGGYSQTDVREFAKMLTGWSVGRGRGGNTGKFAFYKAAHEPGAKTLLGKRYAESGAGEAEAALEMLARHPSTARHVARKLARHFVADTPPDTVVDRLAAVYLESDGDLRAMTAALIDTPEVWAVPLPKVKTPNEFLVSALRVHGIEQQPKRLVGALRLLGQQPFAASSPEGWPDDAAQWVSPNAMLQRSELAMTIARRMAGKAQAAGLLEETIGPVASSATRRAVGAGSDPAEALATVLASPEFQRR